jgi:hypothetical protein
MNAVRHLMHDLEQTIASGSPGRQESTLWQITNLLLVDIERLTDEQIDIFDRVIARLAEAIEVEVRAELARRLAPYDRAPPRVVRALAHDEIAVAHPVLAASPRLDDGDLIAVAQSRTPEHRHAIAERANLTVPVTDTLLSRPDRPLLHKLAANKGARFSDEGAQVLVDEARLDAELQKLLQTRADLPRTAMERVFKLAQATAREHLAATTPASLQRAMEKALTRSTKRVRAAAGTLDYAMALDTIGAIEIGRAVDEEDVLGFAANDQLEEAICAISVCAGLELTAAERLFTVSDSDLLLIVGKALAWRWATVEALLTLKEGEALAPAQLKRFSTTYDDLMPETAQRVLKVVQGGSRAA